MKCYRRAVFETNSSSTHSLVIMPKDQYLKWINSQSLWDMKRKELVEVDEAQIFKLAEEEYNSQKEFYWKDWKLLSDKEKWSFANKNLISEKMNSNGYCVSYDRFTYDMDEVTESYTDESGNTFVAVSVYGYE